MRKREIHHTRLSTRTLQYNYNCISNLQIKFIIYNKTESVSELIEI